MQMVFGEFKVFYFFHIVDILVHGTSKTDHLEHLMMVFQKIREFLLKLKLPKCEFLKRHLQYLGYLIPDESILPLKEKTEMLSITLFN